mgnify:CR=1 FL=1
MEKNNFNYTYSAPEQEEIKKIKEKYSPKTQEVNKMDLLHKLDKSVSDRALIVSLFVGIIGTLIMGLGMSCVLVWTDTLFVPGIMISIIGMLGVALAYPVHQKVYNTQKEKLRPQILKLTEELEK